MIVDLKNIECEMPNGTPAFSAFDMLAGCASDDPMLRHKSKTILGNAAWMLGISGVTVVNAAAILLAHYAYTEHCRAFDVDRHSVTDGAADARQNSTVAIGALASLSPTAIEGLREVLPNLGGDDRQVVSFALDQVGHYPAR